MLRGKLLAHGDGAEKAAFLTGYQPNFGAKAFHQADAFHAHPVGHVDDHRMPQSGTHGGKGNAGIAAGGLRDRNARPDSAFGIRLAQDMQRHAVLDAAGEIVMLRFGKQYTSRLPKR